jgi:CheY-like chemotaxis protein
MKSRRPVLYVDDDVEDQKLMQLAFKEFGFPFKLKIVRDGEEAWEVLEALRDPSELTGIILDLNFPKISGLELLKRIRGRKSLNALPVVVLTSSDDPRDMATARALGYADYLIKPLAYKDLEPIVRRLGAIFDDPGAASDADRPTELKHEK